MTLSAEQITVMIGGKTLLQDVSVSVSPGEVVAVVGPNGAGKSTLLKVLCGDIAPDAGQVSMAERPLHAWKLRDRALMRGILAQSVPLHFAFTVLEVVLMGRSPHMNGHESPQDYDIAQKALALTEVSHLENRVYTTLSGGERQRVQLARVLAQIWHSANGYPRYLLMDEPTNNLDLTHQHGTLQIARTFAAEGVAVFVILHDLNLSAEYADRVMILKDGATLQIGKPEAVLTAENIQTAFKMPVMITDHPLTKRPLILPITQVQEEPQSLETLGV